MPMLEVSRLSVQFGQKKIVDGLSFTVEEGQWLMIVGPNGAGKSTALNAVTQGVPYTGRVLFAGQDVAKMKPALRAQAIGVLAQNHFVGYGFTVEEVVRLGRWRREPGRAVVSVVHDLSLARSFGTDALLMDHGRQIAHGPAAQVLTPERLNAVYGMDVPAWMRSLYAQWAEDNEKAPLPGELARRSRD